VNRAERRAAARAGARTARTFGALVDWHTAAPEEQAAARVLIESLPGGAAVLASGMRFAIVAGEEGSAGAFLLAVADAADLPAALRMAHARLGEYHPAGGATRWSLFVNEATQRELFADLAPLVAH
jgi:hypothetical protein